MSATTYRSRKAAGLCVRCGMPVYHVNGVVGIYCTTHRRLQKEYDDIHRVKIREIDMRPEPKRPPYISDRLPIMPQVPSCCPRCKGFLLTQYEETRCLNCAWYLQPVLVMA